MTWLARVLCRLFGHAWSGTQWDGQWQRRHCRRCALDQWTTTLQ